ncbi:hypothetical protein [Alienimonas californiensis]|uniref:Alpha/beta hydrolase family protein n=1 Tax=Alienimonas californiensis TaxID=2527989 RepID=A0A517PDY3_9PLAN|nr:hypothetical protein [Alienimonas californiensis]QDT17577.1 hypothetical protein CA12_37050 [Alienimonas californiensis]
MLRPAAAVASLAALLAVAGAARAGSVTTKDGTVHVGSIMPVLGLTDDQMLPPAGTDPEKPNAFRPLELIDTLTRRTFVGLKNIAETDPSEDLRSGRVEFVLDDRDPEPVQELLTIGSVANLTPFSDHGRRTVTLATPDGNLDVVQFVRSISAEGLDLASTTHLWRSGLDVSAVPPERLAAMIATDIDPKNPDDRLAVVRFYTEAGLLERAGAELDAVRRDFPELSRAADAAAEGLRGAVGASLLGDLLVRRSAGQHDLVRRALAAFPDQQVPPATARRVADLRAEYADLDRRIGLARVRFDLLHGELSAEDQERYRPFRSEIAESINPDTIARLDPFLQFAADDGLPAADRLALAYSGWAAGPGGADTDPRRAAGLWEARRLLREALVATDGLRVEALRDQLGGLEEVDVLGVRSIIPRLRPWAETATPTPHASGLIGPFETTCDDRYGASGLPGGPPKYTVVLPPGYHPDRLYPSLVVLGPYATGAGGGAAFWGAKKNGEAVVPGPATTRGMVVLSLDLEATTGRPPNSGGGHPYGDDQLRAVEAVVEDARRRFALDPDRCYLTGHWNGGDAAVDVGLARPDLFAAVAAVGGRVKKFGAALEENAAHCPLYLVGGQLEPYGPVRRSDDAERLRDLMKDGHDVTYVEYFGRGRELYPEEVPRILDWFARHTRTPFPKTFDAQVLRPAAARKWWVEAGRLPSSVLTAGRTPGPGRVSTVAIEAEARDGNLVIVRCGAKPVTVWLSPELIDYAAEADVRVNGSRVQRGFLAPEIGPLIEDLRDRGDRTMTFTTKLTS